MQTEICIFQNCIFQNCILQNCILQNWIWRKFQDPLVKVVGWVGGGEPSREYYSSRPSPTLPTPPPRYKSSPEIGQENLQLEYLGRDFAIFNTFTWENPYQEKWKLMKALQKLGKKNLQLLYFLTFDMNWKKRNSSENHGQPRYPKYRPSIDEAIEFEVKDITNIM